MKEKVVPPEELERRRRDHEDLWGGMWQVAPEDIAAAMQAEEDAEEEDHLRSMEENT